MEIAPKLPYDEIKIDMSSGKVTFKYKGKEIVYEQLTHALRDGDTLTLSGIEGHIEIRTTPT